MAEKKNQIPELKNLNKKPPAPPKYLVATNASGQEQVVQLIGEPPSNRPKNAPELPVNANFALSASAKSYDEPAHRFGKKVTSYFRVLFRYSWNHNEQVDSRNDMKGSSNGFVSSSDMISSGGSSSVPGYVFKFPFSRKSYLSIIEL